VHLATGAECALGQLSGAKAGNMGRFKKLVLVPKSVEIVVVEKLEHRVHDAYRDCTNNVARPEPCRESARFFDLFRIHASGRRWTKRQKDQKGEVFLGGKATLLYAASSGHGTPANYRNEQPYTKSSGRPQRFGPTLFWLSQAAPQGTHAKEMHDRLTYPAFVGAAIRHPQMFTSPPFRYLFLGWWLQPVLHHHDSTFSQP
jgi:hypothetical protein